MNALRDVSKVWLVAKMVHTLFESILGNKQLEERLQKAAGRRHAKNKVLPNVNGGAAKPTETPPVDSNDAPPKRKFEEMDLGYSNGPPAPQMSYERSRPQSPAHEVPQQHPSTTHQPMPTMSRTSPPAPQQHTDAFLGTSRQNTRPSTPFNPFSIPGTPPDFFLHTRSSPKISDDLWQNYQPDQLFPPETNNLFALQSPDQQMVDPALRGMPQQPPQGPFAPPQPPNTQSPTDTMHPPPQAQAPQANMQQQQHPHMYADPNSWQYHGGGMQQAPPDDVWSNTSGTSAIVPTALNVGDWFEFFGIPNGDLSALHNGQQGQGGGYG